MAFSLAGIRGVGVKNSDEAKEKIKELKEQYDLIFVSQDVYKENSSEGVVAVPGMKNEKEEDYLKEEIKKAIGIEINI